MGHMVHLIYEKSGHMLFFGMVDGEFGGEGETRKKV